MSFEELNSAVRVKETIERVAMGVVNAMRPTSRYATVISINTAARTIVAQYPDEAATFTAKCGGLLPTANGQIVRIAGQTGDRYVEDVLGATVGSMDPTFTTVTATTLTGQGLNANGAAGTFRTMGFRTGSVLRWNLYADSTAETGAAAGSNLILSRHDDAGTSAGTALSINRATGATSVGGALTATGYTVGSRAGRLVTSVGSAAATASLSLSTQTTPTDITGATVTLTGLVSSDVVVVNGTFDIELPSTAQNTVVIGVLSVGGTAQAPQAIMKAFQASTTMAVRATVKQSWTVTGVSGSVVFKLQANLNASVLSAITVATTHTKFDYMVLSSA